MDIKKLFFFFVNAYVIKGEKTILFDTGAVLEPEALPAFCAENGVPFADAPTLYGKLHRAGVPYLTLMTNNINHPDAFGMELFAIAAARLFEVDETAE